ncbi:hypothetical protein ACFY71_20825 [Streptomyces cinerochromogenes]|uniref:hypothetical protein n=1 Tax=Streptomyces cinerochromogenes TaxID=66422 RepID=UPI0036C4C4CA
MFSCVSLGGEAYDAFLAQAEHELCRRRREVRRLRRRTRRQPRRTRPLRTRTPRLADRAAPAGLALVGAVPSLGAVGLVVAADLGAAKDALALAAAARGAAAVGRCDGRPRPGDRR